MTESSLRSRRNRGSAICRTKITYFSHRFRRAIWLPFNRSLKLVDLDQEQVLLEAGDSIDATYFPTSAVISVVVTLSSGQVVEAAMVGRDGVIGASAALDGRKSLSRAVIQLSGRAMVCNLAELRGAAMQSQPLLSLLIRHEQTLYAQAQQSIACMAAHHVNARLFSDRETYRNAIRSYSRKGS